MNPAVTTPTETMRQQAAEWLALRHARALTLKEEADMGDWLGADARHAAAYAELAAAWKRFDRLAAYPHSADAPADPDLLVTTRRPGARARRRRVAVVMAAAAALCIAAIQLVAPRDPVSTESTPPAAAMARVFRLSDGSLVDVNSGAEVREQFTAAERRVELLQGEAHFAVVKNPERPFIVEAEGVAIRAVGTAFNVRVAARGVEVLVTEGAVEVFRDQNPAAGAAQSAPSVVKVRAGEGTWVSTAETARAIPAVEAVSLPEMSRRLAWQAERLFLDDLPLSEVVARLNRHTVARTESLRLVVADPELNELRISGRLRADDLEGFVDVLETSFGAAAERVPGEIRLRRAMR